MAEDSYSSRLKRLQSAYASFASSGSQLDRVVRVSVLEQHVRAVVDTLGAGGTPAPIFVAEAFQEHLDKSENGRELMRAIGFDRIDGAGDDGVAQWQFRTSPLHRVLLTDALALLAGTRDPDAAVDALAEAAKPDSGKATGGSGEGGAASGGGKEKEGGGKEGGQSAGDRLAAVREQLKDEEDSGKPGGERFRSLPVSTDLVGFAYQPGPVQEQMSRHIASARLALQVLNSVAMAEKMAQDDAMLSATPPQEIQRQMAGMPPMMKLQFMIVAGAYHRYQQWAELLRGGLKPVALLAEITRVNPELKAVPVNPDKVQVLETSAAPLSADALRSESIQNDVPDAPGESQDYVRKGVESVGNKTAESSAKSIVAMFQLEAARMEDRLRAGEP